MFLKSTMIKLLSIALLATGLTVATLPAQVEAASAEEIQLEVNETLEKFKIKISGAHEILAKARGLLVLPDVYQAGFGIGGEYGEGALRVNGATVDFYNMASASYGFQLGAQKKSVILAFMNDDVLANFRTSNGWKVGADGSIALIKIGAEGNIDTKTLNKPIIGFVIGQKGLMYNLSLEGSKFTKIKK